ncbi:MAG: hypothetical protein J6S67_22735 [Methanobrevibacter sp.]|nr:hypothetical protein [Methanobrevibacter sp.]
MAGPVLPNLEPFWAAGINPKTGLPVKFGSSKCTLKEDIKKQLRLVDEQDAVNRYVWYNLPMNLTSQEVERMLYYKGQLCFYYDKDLEEFYFMPYALDGTIDFYGRYNTIHPVPMTSGTEDKGSKAQAQYLAEKKLKCIYGMQLEEGDIDQENSCVLIHDYTKQLSQTIIPRCAVNDPLLDVMSECIPYMRTCLLAGSGIKGIRVNDADQAASVHDAARGMKDAALTQEPWIAIEGSVEMQELTDGAILKAEEYMLAMQSLDNFRLGTMGLDNGGLFEKKAHELQTEADLNGGPVGLVLQDGLAIRQNFCNIVNSIWDLGIWCEPAQNIMGMDNDGDGAIDEDNSDGANTGIENDGGSDNEQ